MPNHPASAPDLAARIFDYKAGTTALHQAAKEGTLQNLSGVTAELLATGKDNHGETPLHKAAYSGHLDQIPGVTAEFLATIKDNYGATLLHVAARYGHLDQIPEVTAELLATVKSNTGNTPLHEAAGNGHLDQIPGVTAEFLATVKNNDGDTPLHKAAYYGHLDQIGDLTLKLVEEMGILNATLQPKNIFVFTEDFRRNGTAYNKRPAIRRALLRAAHALPRLTTTQRSVVKAALSAAQEGGFMLTPKALTKLL